MDSVTTNYFIYNIDYYNRPYFAAFYNDDIEGPTYPVLAHFNESINYPKSTMAAVVGFEIKDTEFLDFNIQFVGSNIFAVKSENKFNYFGVTYFHLLTYYCSWETPYYYKYLDRCYDDCPSHMVANDKTLTCDYK